MSKTTKQRILDEALNMFAENGYKGTNLRDLAQALGISKTALYRHFTNKEDIWNSIVESGEKYYEEHFGSAEDLPPTPDTTDGLLTLTMHQVEFTVHDPFVKKIRRLLAMEQFRNERMAQMATNHYMTGIEKKYTAVFGNMMAKGLMKRDDPAILALEYVSPITMLVHLCDREPAKTEESIERIRKFINHFITVYGTGTAGIKSNNYQGEQSR